MGYPVFHAFSRSAFKLSLLASAFMPGAALAQSEPLATASQEQVAAAVQPAQAQPAQAQSAQAQSAQAQPANSNAPAGLEEVVVTAERRSERLSQVPISVSSFRADAIDKAGVSTSVDLPLLIPSLVQAKGPNADAYVTPFIRGVGSSSTQPGDDASVATYLDGVYQSDKTANLFDLNDIDHIEVSKGPQGTLFGRNATGGAISIITKRPSFTPQFSAEASYGRFDETVDKAYLTGPITDTLAASIAWRYHSGGNWIRDTVDNSMLGGSQGTSADIKILWTPTDRFEATLSAFMNNNISHFSSTGLSVVPGTVPVGGLLGGKFSSEEDEYAGSFISVVREKSVQPQLHLKYSFDDFAISSITSYSLSREASPFDYDGTTANVFYFINNHQVSKAWSQEFQVNSVGDGALHWLGGLYYSDDVEGQNPVYLISGAPQPTTAASFLSPACTIRTAAGCNLVGINASANDQAFAAFGEASYQVTQDDKITAGLRYSVERKRLQGTEQLDLPFASPVDNTPLSGEFPPTSFNALTLATADEHVTYKKPTWRFAYNHDFDENNHAYISYNRGFKSGAYNLTNLTQPAVSPEVIDAYEIGLKATWFGRRVQVNPAFYYYDYSNLQVQKVDGGLVTVQNAGAAELYGFDMDWQVLVTNELRVHGALSVEHSEYSPYNNASSFGFVPGPNPGFGVATTVDATGHSLIYAPVYAFNIGATYNYEFPDDSSLLFDSNFAYTGKYTQVAAAEGNYVFPTENLSASITWTSPDQQYYARVYGRNLTNVVVIGEQLNTVGYFQELQRPRTFGIALGVKFDNFGGSTPPAPVASAPLPPEPAPAPPAPPAPAPEAQRVFQVFFDFDKSAITDTAAQVIAQAATQIKEGKNTQIVVTGHTDTVGSVRYNQHLSERRAAAVKATLVTDGVLAGDITTKGVGKSGLLVPTPDGVREPQNRRAEIVAQ